MAGWEQLGKNPEKMQELMAGFKDPDVWAKAEEMLKDPQYMAAAKAKLAEIQAKAQAYPRCGCGFGRWNGEYHECDEEYARRR